MKKNLVILFTIMVIAILAIPTYAARSDEKGPASVRAYERASGQASFKQEESVGDKVGDWFATLGKPKEEKDRIMAERRALRAARKLEESIEKTRDEMQRGMESTKKETADTSTKQPRTNFQPKTKRVPASSSGATRAK